MRSSFRLPITAASIAFASCVATTALAQSFVMKFGTATVNDPQHEYIKIFKEEIESRSGGRLMPNVSDIFNAAHRGRPHAGTNSGSARPSLNLVIP